MRGKNGTMGRIDVKKGREDCGRIPVQSRRRKAGIRGGALALLLVAVLTLFSCGAREMRYFGYLDTAARGELSIKTENGVWQARLEVGERAAAGALPDLTLAFTAPPSLCGVVVRYEAQSGTWRAALGELETEGDFSAMATPARLLLSESAVQSATRGRQCIAGTWYDTVTLVTEDGATRVLDVATGKPLLVRAVAGGRTWEITVTCWE